MRIGEFVKTTLSEWKGKDCCWIGIRGGDVSCPYWGHPDLSSAEGPEIDPETILDYIGKRKDTLDGIIVGGGEPLASRGLYGLLKKLKAFGIPICLQTYGTCPDELDDIAGAMMVDRVEVFIPTLDEGRFRKAEQGADLEVLLKTLGIVSDMDPEVAYTTVAVPGILEKEDAESMGRIIGDSGTLTIRQFDPARCLPGEFAGLEPRSRKEAAELSASAKRYARRVSLAGFRSPQAKKSSTLAWETGCRVRELRFTNTFASPATFFIAPMNDWSVDITPTDSPHSVSSTS